MVIHLLGIRHHGPGSCRNTLDYLKELKPDLILVEGPAEAEPLLTSVTSPQMRPPVALLAYQPDDPQNAVFYPFAEFSPEWQAMRYAQENRLPFRFFDLPLSYSMAIRKQQNEAAGTEANENEKELTENPISVAEPVSVTDAEEKTATVAKDEIEAETEVESKTETDTQQEGIKMIAGDPFDYLASAAGYPDGESWWDAMVEHRHDSADIFQAVEEAVAALREELPEHTSARDRLREAWMRKMIRAAEKEGFERIAIVCGAWHVPALRNMPKVKEDNELLKGLPKIKIECTWIPWTYDRLSFRSGYGAGIESPGWYHYLWNQPEDDGTLWVSQVAALLRRKNMDISVAHVIETVRLAQATAALRELPHPSLTEYNEAITTVMGFGDSVLLQIIKEELVISDRLGQVPDEVPKVPLLVDIEKIQKRLRVPFTAEIKELTLDLRKPNDLERSIFFHRLNLLEIDWAVPGNSDGKGTFKEKWTLYHKPEQIISIIERAIWGNTLAEATRKYLLKEMESIKHIPGLTSLLNRVLPADLPELVDTMTIRLDTLSAASSDVLEMMSAVPDLVSVVRYGSVRNLDFSKVGLMLRAMIARILAGGALACIHIDEEAAGDILDKLVATDYAISILNEEEIGGMWLDFLRQVRTSAHVHPLLSGYSTRLLNDKGEISQEEMQGTLSYYSSVGNSPSDIAYWFEGFLRSSGSILLLDDNLWSLVNNWVCGLDKETFLELLPIMKRTFSEYPAAERRKLGEKAKHSDGQGTTHPQAMVETDLNGEDAAKVIPVIRLMLGLETKE